MFLLPQVFGYRASRAAWSIGGLGINEMDADDATSRRGQRALLYAWHIEIA